MKNRRSSCANVSPAGSGHCTGSSASNASSPIAASAPISKITPAAVLEGGQRGVPAKDVRRAAISECRRESHPAGDLRHDPPVGPRLARRGQKSPLARDAPLGIGDGAVLLAPRGGGQEDMRAGIHRVVGKDLL